jgi:hypothetical protein
MDISVHFNAPLTIGLCLLPGAFLLAFLMLFLFQRWEIGAFAPAGIALFGCLTAGAVLIMLGIGMNIH